MLFFDVLQEAFIFLLLFAFPHRYFSANAIFACELVLHMPIYI